MADEITKRLERRNEELQSIEESLERLHRRAMRTMNAIDKLRARKKYLLKPNKLPAEAAIKISGEDWHQIRHEVELNDPIDL